MTLHFYWTCLETQKRYLVIDMHSDFLSGVLQHQRNGGLISGQKSANIVTDAFQLRSFISICQRDPILLFDIHFLLLLQRRPVLQCVYISI